MGSREEKIYQNLSRENLSYISLQLGVRLNLFRLALKEQYYVQEGEPDHYSCS